MSARQLILAKANQPAKDLPGRSLRWLADHSQGTTATAVLENELKTGGFVPLHRHEVEELLLCLAGRGEVVLDGRTYAFGAGDTTIVPAGSVHGFNNVGDEWMHVLAFFPCASPKAFWEDTQYQDAWHESAG
jgi:quercetin dioxygenase-like cupin family protein